jgi:tetratricopeptide (TPR) repeat protein
MFKHRFIGLLGILLLLQTIATAQENRSLLRNGNKLYKEGKFADAEVSYRKALEKNSAVTEQYNLGDALYKQGKFAEAAEQYKNVLTKKLDKVTAAKAFHNLGNTLMQDKKYEESVEAYKHALKANPNDGETKYNLAYAKTMLQHKKDQENENPDNVTPSEFANKLKKQAEALCVERKYSEAYELMTNGLKKDPTVRAFSTFIGRIKKIDKING